MRRPVPILLLLALSLASCTTTFEVRTSPGGALLARETGPGSDEGVVYKVLPSFAGAPRIQRTATSRVQLPVLGLRAVDLDANTAASLGAPPWRGVFVERVEQGSAAAAAGLRVGDVLVQAGDDNVHSRAQLDELIRTRMQPGEPVSLFVERWSSADADAERQRVQIELRPQAREVLDEVTESFKLESAPGLERLTGLQLGSVPAELSEAIWGRANTTLLVSGVTLGSPAYDAGLRAADRVLRVDGQAVASLDDVLQRLALHAAARGIPLGADELPQQPAPVGGQLGASRPGRLRLEVDGPLGPHEATLRLDASLDDDFEIHVPILTHYQSSPQRTRWSFLDFIFQFGFNYRSQVLNARTREPATSSKLSLLPFGMFEFSSSPTRDETTLFWFISWSSAR